MLQAGKQYSNIPFPSFRFNIYRNPFTLSVHQNVQLACTFAVMPRCLPTQPVTPRSIVIGLFPGFTCQPSSIMPLLPFTLGLGASPLTL